MDLSFNKNEYHNIKKGENFPFDKIKEKIVEIVRDINLNRFHDDKEYALPFTITDEYVKKLFENKLKVRFKKIHDIPEVGLVNGLYATASGIGGITPVQVLKFPSTKITKSWSRMTFRARSKPNKVADL